MSKLYGKLWNERMSMSTKGAHEEITAQLLYGSAGDSRIAAEVYVIANDGKFTLHIDVPENGSEPAVTISRELEWDNG